MRLLNVHKILNFPLFPRNLFPQLFRIFLKIFCLIEGQIPNSWISQSCTTDVHMGPGTPAQPYVTAWTPPVFPPPKLYRNPIFNPRVWTTEFRPDELLAPLHKGEATLGLEPEPPKHKTLAKKFPFCQSEYPCTGTEMSLSSKDLPRKEEEKNTLKLPRFSWPRHGENHRLIMQLILKLQDFIWVSMHNSPIPEVKKRLYNTVLKHHR